LTFHGSFGIIYQKKHASNSWLTFHGSFGIIYRKRGLIVTTAVRTSKLAS
jgi:hypothetical protein